ncbi:peptidylprolyl isomerase [Pseudoxanthobacter sp.]|uniref:peptidylprolyl isomerase n=1 Tax=Pseudoxanthobacter sp. TaxID=1925742 RepID=UPI002FE25832
MSLKATFRHAVRPLAAALVLSTSLAGVALAQDAGAAKPAASAAAPAKDPTAVVATVNGVKITEADLGYVGEDFGEQLARVPADQRRPILTDVLVDMVLVSQKAEQAGIADTEAFKQRLAFLRTRALRNAYLTDDIAKTVTDADLKARYDAEIAKLPKQQEVHARHILVKTKEEAEKIIKQLEKGADFSKIAKEKSIDTGSGAQGGDLGYFGAGQMVPAFEKAAMGLEIGSFTKEPVQTEFGWHVIRVEDKRDRQPPSFDQVKDQLRDVVLRDKYEALLADLRKSAKIDFIDPSVKPAAPAAGAAPAAPAAVPAK